MVIFHDDDYYQSRIPQPDLGTWGNFRRFVWNTERRTFLDRTATEWGQLGIFYAAFFTVVVSIFTLQMKISIDYVSRLDRPFFQYAGHSIQSSKSVFARSLTLFRMPLQFDSPGIVFKPNSVSTSSPIISINSLNINTEPKRHIETLTHFLQDYNKSISNYNLHCQNERLKPSNNEKPCFFDIKTLGTCGKPPYGYAKPYKPCVLVKFNKRFDWVPKYYNQSSFLPENMPLKLKKEVKATKKLYVWLSCKGANNVDKEHIGEIEYIPHPGFPIEYFPFTGQRDYLSPIVALHFKNLTRNRLLTVECNLWASNVEQSSRYSLDFQIIIIGIFVGLFFELRNFNSFVVPSVINARIIGTR